MISSSLPVGAGFPDRAPRFMRLYEIDTPDAEETFRRMTPTTEEWQIGEKGSPQWKLWTGHEQPGINYVNTFTRLGESTSHKETIESD